MFLMRLLMRRIAGRGGALALPAGAMVLLICFEAQGDAEQTKDGSAALEAELEAVKETQQRILERLDEIEALVRSGPTSRPRLTRVPVDDSPSLGSEEATGAIIEFTDYECAFCAKHFKEVYPRIREEYVETGKVRYILRQFPLVTIHKAASKASEVSLCAGDQHKHWEMHDEMFENQKALDSKDLKSLVEGIGLDSTLIQECLDVGRYTDKVQRDLTLGMQLGVKGTPTFVFGTIEPGASTIQVTRIMRGYVPYSQMAAVLDVLLSKRAPARR